MVKQFNTENLDKEFEFLRIWKILYGLLILTAIAGIVSNNLPTARANHRTASDDHQSKMHSSAADQKEAVCVQSSQEHITHTSFRSNVRRKLYIDNPAEDWDELANNKVFFDMPLVNGAVQPCSGFPNRAAIPIEIYLAHDPTTPQAAWNWVGGGSPCGNVACEDNRVLVFNPVIGHNDSRDSYIWFPERTLYIQQADGSHILHNDSQRAYVVSHEFGHVLGLADGPNTQCAQSIMHAGKGTCVPIAIFWPQQIDRDSVTNIANNG
ncbi:hypothetical protein [Chloroflexus sp.]|uniref:hypothetical protein n=1 Tax=Chloroflexus sp. TaxID=1904827 RepID=UPI002ACEA20A|nr:hypothetical protein [Chloroflexus sp.]